MSIIKYKRDSFEYDCDVCHVEGVVYNREKSLRIKNLIISSNAKIEEALDKILTIFLRIFWREFHIKINKIEVENCNAGAEYGYGREANTKYACAPPL